MNILYVSSLCSKTEYKSIYSKLDIKPGLQAQKYHRLLVEGFQQNEDINITMLSAIPMSRNISKQIFFKAKDEYINGSKFEYIPFINLPIIRQVTLFIYSFKYTLNWGRKNKNSVIICDILNVSIAYASCLAAKILKMKNIGIVTDVPGYLADNSKRKFGIVKRQVNKLKVKINTLIMNRFSSYVFLTEQMNELINKDNKNYVVIEGQVDIAMKFIDNDINKKHKKKVCIYAGSLKKIYGIGNLVEAFINANIENSELHIYGSGNFEDELSKLCNEFENVKYFGVKDNEFIVNEELKATLLINPRPTNEEYTKYSFPSKNMEYMVSGTPILTTKLPGMPKEYNDYVYLIENESVEGLTNTIRNVLNISEYELHEKGIKAKEFVLCKKNNIEQSKKIINMANKDF